MLGGTMKHIPRNTISQPGNTTKYHIPALQYHKYHIPAWQYHEIPHNIRQFYAIVNNFFVAIFSEDSPLVKWTPFLWQKKLGRRLIYIIALQFNEKFSPQTLPNILAWNRLVDIVTEDLAAQNTVLGSKSTKVHIHLISSIWKMTIYPICFNLTLRSISMPYIQRVQEIVTATIAF